MYIIKSFYYLFKSDPCKICLVKPCCNEICEEKHSWNFYKWGKPKLAIVLFGILYLATVVVIIIVKIFEYIK
jgi:hypothetical protein